MPATATEISHTLGPLIQVLGTELGVPISNRLLDDLVRDAVSPQVDRGVTGVPGLGDGWRQTAAGLVVSIVVTAYQDEIRVGRDKIEDALANLPTQTERLMSVAKAQLCDEAPANEIERIVREAVEKYVKRG